MLKQLCIPILFLVISFLIMDMNLLMYIFPVAFGLIIGLVNIDLLKINKVKGIILSILISVSVFFLCLFLTIFIAYLLGNSAVFISGAIASFVIYFCFTKIYNDQVFFKGFQILFFFSLLVPVFYFLIDKNLASDLIDEPFLYTTIWVVLMGYGFGLALNSGRISNKLFLK